MNKHTIGQKLKLSNNVDVEIVAFDEFGYVEHYGVVYFIREVGQDTKSNIGWIPVAVLDAMNVIVL